MLHIFWNTFIKIISRKNKLTPFILVFGCVSPSPSLFKRELGGGVQGAPPAEP